SLSLIWRYSYCPVFQGATSDLRLNAGISNLFDKQIYRENEGASTYNEPGRAYYAGVTISF
ncbi:TonB-dependent receptor, partial [Klebsiella michiganensis]|uniref:TonB-dependent receptor n=1 Tax=Klebsiella michiganensis TaxID=1134687 RepID=UPI001F156312